MMKNRGRVEMEIVEEIEESDQSIILNTSSCPDEKDSTQ